MVIVFFAAAIAGFLAVAVALILAVTTGPSQQNKRENRVASPVQPAVLPAGIDSIEYERLIHKLDQLAYEHRYDEPELAQQIIGEIHLFKLENRP